MKVVFDTNTVISALLFRGKLNALVKHWQQPIITPLICQETHHEFLRVLSYPKFKLKPAQIEIVVSYYVPYAKTIEFIEEYIDNLPTCRDNKDQIFLKLALAGQAQFLITGDTDLLTLKGQTPFEIITPIEYLTHYI